MTQSLEIMDAGFVSRRDQVSSMGEGAERTRAERDVNRLGRATHWEAITRLGVIVEQAVSLLIAYEAYRSGRRGEIAMAFLRHALDPLTVLNEKKRRKLTYWDELIQVPTLAALMAEGLNAKDARFLHDAYRKAALNLLATFQRMRNFYTPALHHVYTRYKHGYTVVDPAASQIGVRPIDGRLEPLNEAMAGGFAVLHASMSGAITLNIVKSDPTELHATMNAAREAAYFCRVVADGWLNRVEHRDERTLVVAHGDEQDPRLARLIKKWVGPGLDRSFPLDDLLEEILGVRPPIRQRAARALSQLCRRGL